MVRIERCHYGGGRRTGEYGDVVREEVNILLEVEPRVNHTVRENRCGHPTYGGRVVTDGVSARSSIWVQTFTERLPGNESAEDGP
ncbi:hypothetical protein GCM10008957_35440 [Deinococcus ruber]|uniref:Uncharacterized protein n=1 Tax=Deinococcus ruber TaxID=1848197 RepID=A0A918CG99_9DEIO|nr:hypothetical protein GCM10008957_35440 [Deinococcus ruber]